MSTRNDEVDTIEDDLDEDEELWDNGPPEDEEPACIYCGCTESNACETDEGPCSWIPGDAQVCSNPECVAKHETAQAGALERDLEAANPPIAEREQVDHAPSPAAPDVDPSIILEVRVQFLAPASAGTEIRLRHERLYALNHVGKPLAELLGDRMAAWARPADEYLHDDLGAESVKARIYDFSFDSTNRARRAA